MDINEISSKLIKAVVENSGADRGFLLFHENSNGVFEIKSMYLCSSDRNKIDFNNKLPQTVLDYVFNSKFPLVLHDALKERGFNKDTYIVQNMVKSILCQPLLRSDHVIGMLYLENRMSAGIFTEDRVKLVSVITAQYVLNIENFQLIDVVADSECKYKYFECSIQDIAKEKESDSLRLEKEAAEAIAKIRLLANMSHEIRTSINTILGYSQLLNDHAVDEKTIKYIENIMSNGRWLLRLIDEILDFAKIENGKIKLNNEPNHYYEEIKFDSSKKIVADENDTLDKIEELFATNSSSNDLFLEVKKIKEDKWSELINTMIIGDIAKFANDVSAVGVKYHYKPLVDWGNALSEYTKDYNVQDINSTLKQFPKIVACLEVVE